MTLKPGLYSGEVKQSYNTTLAFDLSVLGPDNVEVAIDGKRITLVPEDKNPTRYYGHLDAEGTAHVLLEFDPRTNDLRVINEEVRTVHTSTSWQAEVRSVPRAPTTITDTMRVG